MGVRPPFRAERVGAPVERPVCAVIARHRGPQVVWPVRVGTLGGLLRGVAGATQIAVQQARDDLVARDRREGGRSDSNLAAVVMRCPMDGVCGDLGLIDGRYRLRLVRESGLDPSELRRVQGRHLHHRDVGPDCGRESVRTGWSR